MKPTLQSPLPTFLTLLIALLFSSSLFAQDSYHHLIAGSFDNLKAANEMAEAFSARSYAPTVLLPKKEGDNYRVSIYRSDSRAEVDAFAKSLGSAGKNYWVLSLRGAEVIRTNARMTEPGKVIDPDANSYHLILESVDDFETAEAKVAELEKEGYEPYIIHPNAKSGWYRVSVFMSQDKGEIDAYQGLLRKRKRYAGWIYEARPGEPAVLAGINTSFESSPGVRFVGENQRSSTQSETRGTATHYLITGSFENFDQASRLSDALRLKGYNPLIMFPDPGVSEYFRVSVYQSTQRNRVEEFQKKYQKDTERGGAWIFTQK